MIGSEKIAVVLVACVGAIVSAIVFALLGASLPISLMAGVCGGAGLVRNVDAAPFFIFLWCVVGGAGPIDSVSWVVAGAIAAVVVQVSETMRGDWNGRWFSAVAGCLGLVGCVLAWPLGRDDGIVLDVLRRLCCVGLAIGGSVMVFNVEGVKNFLYRRSQKIILDDLGAAREIEALRVEAPIAAGDDGGEEAVVLTADETREDESDVDYGDDEGEEKSIDPADEWARIRDECLQAAAEESALAAQARSEPEEYEDEDDQEEQGMMNAGVTFENVEDEVESPETVGILISRLCSLANEARHSGDSDDWIEFCRKVEGNAARLHGFAGWNDVDPDEECILFVMHRIIEGDSPETTGRYLRDHHPGGGASDAPKIDYVASGGVEAPEAVVEEVVAATAVAAVVEPVKSFHSKRWSQLAEKLKNFVAGPIGDGTNDLRLFKGRALGSEEERRSERPDRSIAGKLTACDRSPEKIDRVVVALGYFAGLGPDHGLGDDIAAALRRYVRGITSESLAAPEGNFSDMAPVGVLVARLALCILRKETLAALARIDELMAISDPEQADEEEGEDLKPFVAFLETDADWRIDGFSAWTSEAYAKFALEKAQVTHDVDEDDEERRMKLGQAMALLGGRPESERIMFHHIVDLAKACDAIDGRISAEIVPGMERDQSEYYHALTLVRRMVLKIDDKLASSFRDPVNITRIIEGLSQDGMEAVKRVRGARASFSGGESDSERKNREISELKSRLEQAENHVSELEAEHQRELGEARKAASTSVGARSAAMLKKVMADLIVTDNKASSCALHYYPAGRSFGVAFLDGMGEDWEVRMVEGGEVELYCLRIEASYRLLQLARRMIVAEPFRPGTRPVVRICIANAGARSVLTVGAGLVFRLEALLVDEVARHEFLVSTSSFDEKIATFGG